MEDNIITSGYDSIKQNLLQQGFQLEDNHFIKEMIQTHQMIVNGQDCSREIKQSFVIEYIGEGSREDHGEVVPLYGFTLKPDGQTGVIDVWASGWDEFRELTEG